MRRNFFIVGMLVLGAAMLAPAIALIGLDPVPGDFTFHQGNTHLVVPVTYSLCASAALALLYLFARR